MHDSIPQVTPEFSHVKGIVADRLPAVLGHEVGGVALHKVKTPAGEADVVLQPVHPVDQALAQVGIGVVQICSAVTSPSAGVHLARCGCCTSSLQMHMLGMPDYSVASY